MAHHSSPTTYHSSHDRASPSPGSMCRALGRLRDVELTWGEPLSRLTTFRIGGPVACVARPHNSRAVGLLMEIIRNEELQHFMLGGGSNILAPDGPWNAVAVQLNRTAEAMVRIVAVSQQRAQVQAGAGMKLSSLLRFCVRERLEGLEYLVGIPGTIGGALVMNAGTKEGCIADALLWVEFLDDRGKTVRLQRSELAAGYRRMGLPAGIAVTGATFELRGPSGDSIKGRMAATMRQRKQSQPLGWPSAGCIFKNPEEGSAGALIDGAGLKGLRVGDAQVSHKHANWIINLGNATASHVLALIRQIEQEVFSRYAIRLEKEICILGP